MLTEVLSYFDLKVIDVQLSRKSYRLKLKLRLAELFIVLELARGRFLGLMGF